MPRAVIDGDRVRITGVRNFDYRSRSDFTVRYEEREMLLSHLVALDFYVSYFMEGPVGHTFVSFIFDNAPPLSISIETRPEVGEGFAPVASMFKQFELIYVVGDERDLVGVRANHRQEPSTSIVSTPRRRMRAGCCWSTSSGSTNSPIGRSSYHLLTNSCTINIVRYANAAGREGRIDIRHILNGLADSYLYRSGRIDTTLPFDELRRRSHIQRGRAVGRGCARFLRTHSRFLADHPSLTNVKSCPSIRRDLVLVWRND